MLSYQHGFHAGNRADVLKHAVLHDIFSEAAAAASPLLYVETHSGRGVYDLISAEARKSGEAKDGVLKLLDNDSLPIMRPWLDHVRKAGIRNYPGSPALALGTLGKSARAIFFERHPAEYAALDSVIGKDVRVQIKQADGFSGALKLAPRGGERMIVFSDPSYETASDTEALINWTPRAMQRWPDAQILIWVPLFRDRREDPFLDFLASLEATNIAEARWPVSKTARSSLEGTAMVLIRTRAASRAVDMAAALESLWRTGKP